MKLEVAFRQEKRAGKGVTYVDDHNDINMNKYVEYA
jgi:hypothetical protein